MARVKKGERFGELARDSSDADSAKNFGELGGYKREDLKKEIADLVFAQNHIGNIRVGSGHTIENTRSDRLTGVMEFELWNCLIFLRQFLLPNLFYALAGLIRLSCDNRRYNVILE